VTVPLAEILRPGLTIAVVGLSSSPFRPSYGVAEYLQGAGFRIIPVNPNETEVLGERAYPSLAAIPEAVDIVNVFRRSEYAAEIARDAVAIGAGVLWLQEGVWSREAEEVGTKAKLTVIMDRCIATDHRQLVRSGKFTS